MAVRNSKISFRSTHSVHGSIKTGFEPLWNEFLTELLAIVHEFKPPKFLADAVGNEIGKLHDYSVMRYNIEVKIAVLKSRFKIMDWVVFAKMDMDSVLDVCNRNVASGDKLIAELRATAREIAESRQKQLFSVKAHAVIWTLDCVIAIENAKLLTSRSYPMIIGASRTLGQVRELMRVTDIVVHTWSGAQIFGHFEYATEKLNDYLTRFLEIRS